MLLGRRCAAPRVVRYVGRAGGRWVAVWGGAEGDGGLGRGWRRRNHLSHSLDRLHGAGDGARRRCRGLGGSPRRARRPVALTARVCRVPQVREQEEGGRRRQELGGHPLSSSCTARCGASVADSLRGHHRVVPRVPPGHGAAPAAGDERDGRKGAEAKGGMGWGWRGLSRHHYSPGQLGGAGGGMRRAWGGPRRSRT